MRAYERFIRYVKIHTTSDESSDTCPSTQRQFELARLLAEELRSMGVAEGRVDDKCYVYGSIPATAGMEKCPALGFIAHIDTSDAASGENVAPMLHENYHGGDLMLPEGTVLSLEKFPFLPLFRGETLITSDGSTLLDHFIVK